MMKRIFCSSKLRDVVVFKCTDIDEEKVAKVRYEFRAGDMVDENLSLDDLKKIQEVISNAIEEAAL